MSQNSVYSSRRWRGNTQSGDLNYEGVARYCDCRLKAAMWVCWKDGNVGRRFFGCANLNCKYFRWFDTHPLSERGRTVVQMLLDNEEKLQAKVKDLESIRDFLQESNEATLIEVKYLYEKLDKAGLDKSDAFWNGFKLCFAMVIFMVIGFVVCKLL